MSFRSTEAPQWIDINRQPGYTSKNIPECPHYQLLEICASLVQISPDTLLATKQFCGLQIYDKDSIGSLSGFKGKVWEPQTTCAFIYYQLKQVVNSIDLAKHGDKPTQDRLMIALAPAIFRNCCVPGFLVEPETQGHRFEMTNLPENLGVDEVFSRTQSFFQALRDQVTGDDLVNSYEGRYQRGALYCPQAPKRKEDGVHAMTQLRNR